jgi:hypothetical protein
MLSGPHDQHRGNFMSITLPMSLVSALSGLVLTVADAPPKFNPAAGCKAAAAAWGDLPVPQSYDSCMKDEESARLQLVQTWSKYIPQDKSRCVAETEVGGKPSYVEILECLLEIVGVDKPIRE